MVSEHLRTTISRVGYYLEQNLMYHLKALAKTNLLTKIITLGQCVNEL